MAVHLSEHFTYKKLLKATLPSILMMVFTSLYSIVDGLFVSNIVGETAFASLNLFWPICAIIGSLGFMMGAGGAALTAKMLGEGDNEKANKIFSCCVYFTIALGLVLSLLVFFFVEPIAKLLGATEEMLPYCKIYGKILIGAEVAFMLQNLFQNFFIVAEKAGMGFITCIIAGITNMVLDALFILGFNWGLAGAAIATITGQIVGAVIPIIFFSTKINKTPLKLGKTKFQAKVIFKACTNGSSELLSNIAISVVSIVYNFKLMQLIGENGVSAYGIIMYISYIFVGVFMGYAVGTAPIISYNFGAKNNDELKNVLKKSIVINIVFGVVMTCVSELVARVFSSVFVGANLELLNLTTIALRIYSISFIFMGLNVFASSFFTALNNGLISAIISIVRTLVFQISAVLILSVLFGVNGIWSAIIVAEIGALIMGIIFLIANKKKYKY